MFERVGNQLVAAGQIASDTGVEQVVVIGCQGRVDGSRNEMIDCKRAFGVDPLLASQAIDATKREFIPQRKIPT